MRTTIRINDRLLNEVKKLALSSNMTLSGLVENALREMVSRRQKNTEKPRIELITFKGRGLKHGVDLDDTAALLEIMQEDYTLLFQPVIRDHLPFVFPRAIKYKTPLSICLEWRGLLTTIYHFKS